MAIQIKPLKSAEVLALKPKGSSRYLKAVDNDGLYVRVSPSSKSWVMRKAGGWETIGSVDDIPLAKARELVGDRKRSPVDEKQKPMPLFKNYQEVFIDNIKETLKKDRHGETKNGKQWSSTILKFCMNPDSNVGWDISKKRIDQITPTDIKEIMVRVLPLVTTAGKLRGRIERIIDAAWTEHRMGTPYSNPASSKVINQLVPMLAKESKLVKAKAKHHMAVPIDDAPKIFQDCWEKRKSSVSMSALCFTILSVGRASNGVEAKWSEIDWDKKVWQPESMKVDSNPAHIVPLSPKTMELLEMRKILSDDECEWIFASNEPATRGNPITTDSMRLLLQRMTGKAYTTHGWRSTYKNWSLDDDTEELDVDTLSELGLSHKIEKRGGADAPQESRLQKAMLGKKIGSDTYLAYLRSGLFKKRIKHGQDWESFLFSKTDRLIA